MSTDAPDGPPAEVPPTDPRKVEAYRALIGPIHQDYYLSYFRRAEERGYAPMSWNWPVFFFDLLWLLWRRQYRWALITFLFAMVSVMLAGAIGQATGSETFGSVVFYVLVFGYFKVFLPLKANALYFEWSQQMIKLAQHQLPGQQNEQQALLTRFGGVNNNIPIILLVILLLLSLLGGPPPELATQ